MKTRNVTALAAAFALVAALFQPTPSQAGDENALKALLAEQQREQANLATFDDLDYNVFSGQKWAELHRSHSHDVTVHWPDGHSTQGIEKHIADLQAMFVWAPDTRIKEHPVKIAQGEWTAVIGYMEGTFTQPMPAGEGKTIPPTGKVYRIRMATISHWNSEGVMDEEYLFWDNQEFMKQIGLGE